MTRARARSRPSAGLATTAAALLAAASALPGCAPQGADAPAPLETRIARPGRWELQGARHVWIEPDAHPRLVEPGRVVPGRWAWRDGRYVWEAARVVATSP